MYSAFVQGRWELAAISCLKVLEGEHWVHDKGVVGMVPERGPHAQVYSAFVQGQRELAATFSLTFLEGMHWKEAAALFDGADVVVTPHGAQASGAVFMPHDSQFLHFANNAGHKQSTAWAAEVSSLFLAAPRGRSSPPCSVMQACAHWRLTTPSSVRKLRTPAVPDVVPESSCPSVSC